MSLLTRVAASCSRVAPERHTSVAIAMPRATSNPAAATSRHGPLLARVVGENRQAISAPVAGGFGGRARWQPLFEQQTHGLLAHHVVKALLQLGSVRGAGRQLHHQRRLVSEELFGMQQLLGADGRGAPGFVDGRKPALAT